MVTVRSINTQDEFEALDALYHHFFGSSSTPTTILKNRWQAYPEGLIGLFNDELLIGGLSIWPLNRPTYDQLEQGFIKEAGIQSENLDTSQKSSFYLAEIAIHEAERSFGNLEKLLQGFLNHLLSQSTLPASILALEFSTKGMNLLQKLGFQLLLPASQTADAMPLLQLHLTTKDAISSKIHQLRHWLGTKN